MLWAQDEIQSSYISCKGQRLGPPPLNPTPLVLCFRHSDLGDHHCPREPSCLRAFAHTVLSAWKGTLLTLVCHSIPNQMPPSYRGPDLTSSSQFAQDCPSSDPGVPVLLSPSVPSRLGQIFPLGLPRSHSPALFLFTISRVHILAFLFSFSFTTRIWVPRGQGVRGVLFTAVNPEQCLAHNSYLLNALDDNVRGMTVLASNLLFTIQLSPSGCSERSFPQT